jgi:AcrR family transcriptional regulator
MARPLGTLDPRKREAILAAADKVFLAHGYRASVDDIAGEARVSKQTVYSHFGSKGELLSAIVNERAQALSALLSETAAHGTIEETLTAFGRGFLSTVLAPHVIGLYRLVVSQAAEFPELARVYYEAGPKANARQLAAYLEGQARAGRLDIDDPLLAAELFLGHLLAYMQLRATLFIAFPSAAEIELRVERCVRQFLDVHQIA